MKTSNFLNALYIMAMAAFASASRAPHFRNSSSIVPGNDSGPLTPYGSNSGVAPLVPTIQNMFLTGASYPRGGLDQFVHEQQHTNATLPQVGPAAETQEGWKNSLEVISSFASNVADYLPTSALSSPEARQELIEKLETMIGLRGYEEAQKFHKELIDSLNSENWPEVGAILKKGATFVKEQSSDPKVQASVAGIATVMFVVAMYANPELLTHMSPTLEYEGRKPVDKGNRQEASNEPATEPSSPATVVSEEAATEPLSPATAASKEPGTELPSPRETSSFSLNALNPAKLLKLSPHVLVLGAAVGFGNLMQGRVQGNIIGNTIAGGLEGGAALANIPVKAWDLVKVNGPAALKSIGEYLGSTSYYEDIPRDALNGHFAGATSNSTEWGHIDVTEPVEAVESGQKAYNSLFERGVEQDVTAPNTSSWDDAPILAQVQDTIDKLSTLTTSKAGEVSQFATEVLTQARGLKDSMQKGAKEGINAAAKSIAQSIENLTSKIQDNTGLTPDLQAALGAGATILVAGMFAYRKEIANAVVNEAKQLANISPKHAAAVSAVVLLMYQNAANGRNFFGELASGAIALPDQLSQMFTGLVDIVAEAPYREMANAASLAVGTALSDGIQGIATDLSGPATAIDSWSKQAGVKIVEYATTLLRFNVTKEIGTKLQEYWHLGSEPIAALQEQVQVKLSELYNLSAETLQDPQVKTTIDTLIAVAATLTVIVVFTPMIQQSMKGEEMYDIPSWDEMPPTPHKQEAATKIQSAFRGHNAKKEAKYEQAAQELRNIDASLFEDIPSSENSAEDQRSREEAATKIQSAFRGHNARKEAKYEQAAQELRNIDASLSDNTPSSTVTSDVATTENSVEDQRSKEEVGSNQSPQELRNKDVSLFDDTPSTAQAQDNALSKLDETMARIRAERNQASAEAQTSNWLRDAIADRRKNTPTKDRLPTIAEETPQELEEEHDPARDTLFDVRLTDEDQKQTQSAEASTPGNEADTPASKESWWKSAGKVEKGAAIGATAGTVGSLVVAFCFSSLIVGLATAIPTFGLSIPIMAIVMAGALIATGAAAGAGIGAAAGKAADSFQDKVQDQGPSPEPGSSR